MRARVVQVHAGVALEAGPHRRRRVRGVVVIAEGDLEPVRNELVDVAQARGELDRAVPTRAPSSPSHPRCRGRATASSWRVAGHLRALFDVLAVVGNAGFARDSASPGTSLQAIDDGAPQVPTALQIRPIVEADRPRPSCQPSMGRVLRRRCEPRHGPRRHPFACPARIEEPNANAWKALWRRAHHRSWSCSLCVRCGTGLERLVRRVRPDHLRGARPVGEIRARWVRPVLCSWGRSAGSGGRPPRRR